jgi:hypothetical protein
MTLFISRIGVPFNSLESSEETVCFPTPGVPETMIFRYKPLLFFLLFHENFKLFQSGNDYFKNNH